MPNTGSGRLGEQLTAEYLEEKGYEIVSATSSAASARSMSSRRMTVTLRLWR